MTKFQQHWPTPSWGVGYVLFLTSKQSLKPLYSSNAPLKGRSMCFMAKPKLVKGQVLQETSSPGSCPCSDIYP